MRYTPKEGLLEAGDGRFRRAVVRMAVLVSTQFEKLCVVRELRLE
jgi:hypothetical protein